MKRIFLFISLNFIILLFAGVSCNDDEDEKLTVCGVEDPIENLSWIKEKIGDPNSWATPEIYYLKYNNADYIASYYPPSSWSNSVRIYNCQGEEICYSNHLDEEWCEIWVNCEKKILLNP